jgi:hypothetical protein
MIMSCARRDEAGTISGAIDALEACCRVGAPLLGGLLLQHVHRDGPPTAGILLALAGGAALYEVAPVRFKAPKPPTPPEGKKGL